MLARVANILLAAMVFFSTTGVVLNRHYCQNQLRKATLFVSAQSCHHQMDQQPPCHRAATHCTHDGNDNGCCHDDSQYVHSDQVKVVQSPAPLVLPTFKPWAPQPVCVLRLSANDFLPSFGHQRYRPPDLPVPSHAEAAALLQVFRC
ncbi:MAG: hypothetical protein D6794_00925 [Deltaproteobacteria bacterium]|nr:MAG: hypothetical protein D6794_00925 [Deltaproteobacteria bacterium]